MHALVVEATASVRAEKNTRYLRILALSQAPVRTRMEGSSQAYIPTFSGKRVTGMQ